MIKSRGNHNDYMHVRHVYMYCTCSANIVYVLRTHHSWNVDSDSIHLGRNFGVVTEASVD